MEIRRKGHQKGFAVLICILCALCFFSCSEKQEETDRHEVKNALNPKPDTGHIKKQTVPEFHIDIQPYDGINEELAKHIYKELSKVHSNVALLPVISLPERAYYKPRNRYRADTLIFLQRKSAKPGHVIVGLTNKDISTTDGKVPDWGVMGLGYQPGQACVVSTYRLSKSNIKEQFFKVAIHELGHTQGLNHCSDITCLMTDAKGKNNTNKEKGFCEKCKNCLKDKGFKL